MSCPMDLRDYVKIYDGFMSPGECKEIVDGLADAEWQKHQYYSTAGYTRSYDKELSVAWSDAPSVRELQGKMWLALDQYVNTDMKFAGRWFPGVSGYTPVRFNRYSVDTRMKLHCDHIHDMFDGERKGIPILSVLGALNDDYEGGDLVFWESEVIKLKAGSIMIFPSNFLYPHKVKEVTSGVRYSYVSWAW